MRLEAWVEILAAHEDVARAVDQAFARAPADVDLDALQAVLWRRLERLRTWLTARAAVPDDVMRVLAPLLFTYDERIFGRLAAGSVRHALEWRPLQRAVCTVSGGDAFFDRAAELEAATHPPELELDVYLFCLQEGFEGRHSDDPAELARWKDRLAAKLEASYARPPAEGRVFAPPAVRSAAFYVLATAAFVLGWNLLLAAIARTL